LVVAHDC